MINLSQALYFARRYDETIGLWRQVPKTNQEDGTLLGWAYERKGMYEEAIAEFRAALDLPGDCEASAALGHAYAVSGRADEARKVLEELTRRSKGAPNPACLAVIYAGLGDKDRAFDWLNKTFEDEDRRNKLSFIKVDPIFDGLRPDPRYAALLRRMRLGP
jgi:tetratricopeptide (TPR) repeat protein